MAAVLKKENADKIAFSFQPKKIHLEPSKPAVDFVEMQIKTSSEFKIADVVAKQSGVREIQKKNIEAQVDETVLEKIKEIEESAYQKSYDLGMIEGREKGYKDQMSAIVGQLKRFDDLNSHIDVLMSKVLKESETQIIKLVYEIAKRIAIREINLNTAPIAELLSHLVEEIQAANQVHIRLNPEDFKFIEELRQKSAKEVESLMRMKIEPRDEVTRGGCLIETEYGTIDATIEQRIDMAWKALEPKLPNLGKA